MTVANVVEVVVVLAILYVAYRFYFGRSSWSYALANN